MSVYTRSQDLDGDGFCPESPPFDCREADTNTHPGAPETNDGRDNRCPGDPGYGVIDEVSGASGFP